MVVLANLSNPGQQFGALRVWAPSVGSQPASIVSYVLHADASTLIAGSVPQQSGSSLPSSRYPLPPVTPQAASTQRRWKELLGLESLQLLRNRQHRSRFHHRRLSCSLRTCRFIPFTAIHLHDLQISSVSAVMSPSPGPPRPSPCMHSHLSLGRFQLRTLFLAAIATSALRYFLFALNQSSAVFAGIFLRGVTVLHSSLSPPSIYVEQHIEHPLHALPRPVSHDPPYQRVRKISLVISAAAGYVNSTPQKHRPTICASILCSLSPSQSLQVGIYFIQSHRTNPSA